jgi:hypothetical protein
VAKLKAMLTPARFSVTDRCFVWQWLEPAQAPIDHLDPSLSQQEQILVRFGLKTVSLYFAQT